MSAAFILECIKSRFDLIHKPRIIKYDTNRQKKTVFINTVGSKITLEALKIILEKSSCGNSIEAHMFFCEKFL